MADKAADEPEEVSDAEIANPQLSDSSESDGDAGTAEVDADRAGESDEAGESSGTEQAEAAEPLEAEAGESSESDTAVRRAPMSPLKAATVVGLVLVLATGGLAGWSVYQYVQNRHAQQDREMFLAVGRQAAVNLTSIGFENADADVQRVLDSATGTFYDEFNMRAQPFIEVVKQAKSKSTGVVNAAALESVDGDEATVLVAVTINSSNAGAPNQQPRDWRMKVTVEKVAEGAKVSKVDFVK
jgi:Mce-associated membrane protein